LLKILALLRFFLKLCTFFKVRGLSLKSVLFPENPCAYLKILALSKNPRAFFKNPTLIMLDTNTQLFSINVCALLKIPSEWLKQKIITDRMN
jgi:hypothetical protein